MRKRKCEFCGNTLDNGDAFCKGCGNPVKNNEEVVEAVVEGNKKESSTFWIVLIILILVVIICFGLFHLINN